MSIDIRLLGHFDVLVDGEPVDPAAWKRRSASALVKLLALSPSRSLHRERVIDALWPDVPVEDAAPRLHKAAHYARKALGQDDAVVLRADTVALLPEGPVRIDVAEFERLAARAEADGGPEAAAAALGQHGGELLPDDVYEPWLETDRERLRERHLDLLRQARRWTELLTLDPADETAHLALMREHARAGDRRAALRQFERLDRALRAELGVAPSRAALATRDALLSAEAAAAPAAGAAAEDEDLVGRDSELRALDELLDRAGRGAGRAAFLSGPAGSGKSTLLARALARATALGWRTGRGSAARIEGAWPYAPVIEALADLCRGHPALLDGLADEHRSELERALSLSDLAWSPDGGHQRLFVAAAELLRLAAAGHGAVLVVDDAHDSDEASLRLLHHLARACASSRVLVLIAHRPTRLPAALQDTRASLVGRGAAVELALQPLDRDAVRDLVERHARAPDDALIDQIAALSEGVPLAVEELARRAAAAPGELRPLMTVLTEQLPRPVREVLSRVAVAGTAFDTDEFVALSELDEALAYDALDDALASGALSRDPAGYRFRHPLLRDALLDALPSHRRRLLHRHAAERLAALGASAARVGHHLLAAGDVTAAVPHLLRAARTEAAVGAYRDALSLLQSVREEATGELAAELHCLRGDLLARLGDPQAVNAYREAARRTSGEQNRHARAGLARAAVAAGDLDTAAVALDGLELGGGPSDGSVLLARGHHAFARGDVDTAWAVAQQARGLLAGAEDSWEILELVALQGLIAHQRGEWFSRLTTELQAAAEAPRLVTAVLDANLCVSEYLLYGPTPYRQVLALADGIRRSAERAGSLRGVAFAESLAGEAALLSGDLERAERSLSEAVDLHAEIGARAGEAHSLQRLAEVRLARGDKDGARELLDRALPLARWSPLAMHLLQRIHGSLITAAPDPTAAREAVEMARATTDDRDACYFCAVMFAVPAAIACADVGDVEQAREHLAVAERSTALWSGTAWQAATLEARAHLVAAEGDPAGAARLLRQAAEAFQQAGQPLDAARCRAAAVVRLPAQRAVAAMLPTT
jgi:DNA-binding SARP family transcriptional activator/tetratricopeptide (TPR) repeat protein